MKSIHRNASFHPLERFCHLLILTALAGSIFAYPLFINEQLLMKIGRFFPKSFLGRDLRQLYETQIIDAIRVFSLPLLLKETVAAVAILLLLGVWCWWRTLRLAQARDSWKSMFTPLHAPLGLLIVWMAVSLCWTPSFNYSLRTFSTALLGLLFFAIVFDLRKPERLVRRWINLFLAMMLIVAGLSFLQHAWPEKVFLVFPEVGGARNRIGSFIGHNTALAAFSLCTCYFLLARLFEKRTALWLRGLLSLYVMLLLFLIVSAQSRGVWLMALIGIPLVVWRAARLGAGRQGLMILGALAVAGALCLAPFQFSDNSLNLTRRKGAQALMRRLGDFSWEIIKKGTRFRILTCSAGLVAAKPIQGHGIGSFRYVYPEQQGRYFLEHPDTTLQPTRNKTGRAHNDYLQLAIELGLVGLALALWLIAAAWRGGQRGARASADSEPEDKTSERLTYLPIGASCLTILAHGFFDFPVHIICYALLLAFLGAIWASRGRDRTEAEVGPVKFFERDNPGRMNFRLVALLSLCFCSSLLIVFITPWFVAPLQQGVFLCRGNTYITDFTIKQDVLTDAEKSDRLEYARQMYEKAVDVDPGDGEARFALANAQGICAEFVSLQYPLALEDQDQEWSSYLQNLALDYYGKSLANLELALQEVDYHSVYAVMGRCYAGRLRFTGSAEDMQKAIWNLEEAIKYSPADYGAILLLDKLLALDPLFNFEKLTAYRRLLYRYSPDEWSKNFMKEVALLLEAEDYRRALELLFSLQEAAPQDQDILSMIISCHVELEELATARGLIASAMSSGKMTLLTENRCQLMIAMSEGDWRSITRRSRQLLDDPDAFVVDFSHPFEQRENEKVLLRLCSILAREKLGEPEATRDLAKLEQEFEARDPASVRSFQTSLAMLLLQHFEQPERGMALIDQLREDDLLYPNNLTIVVRYWLKQGDSQQARKYLDLLRERFPRYFLIPQLELEIKAIGQPARAISP